jgi:hypothetical protein
MSDIMKGVLLLTILINEKNQFKTAFTRYLDIPYIMFMNSEYWKITYCKFHYQLHVMNWCNIIIFYVK